MCLPLLLFYSTFIYILFQFLLKTLSQIIFTRSLRAHLSCCCCNSLNILQITNLHNCSVKKAHKQQITHLKFHNKHKKGRIFERVNFKNVFLLQRIGLKFINWELNTGCSKTLQIQLIKIFVSLCIRKERIIKVSSFRKTKMCEILILEKNCRIVNSGICNEYDEWILHCISDMLVFPNLKLKSSRNVNFSKPIKNSKKNSNVPIREFAKIQLLSSRFSSWLFQYAELSPQSINSVVLTEKTGLCRIYRVYCARIAFWTCEHVSYNFYVVLNASVRMQYNVNL